nr:MAG TPA: hypothetical protein [Bacteriophage sp.]
MQFYDKDNYLYYLHKRCYNNHKCWLRHFQSHQ